MQRSLLSPVLAAGIAGALTVASIAPGLARPAHRTADMHAYRASADAAYAYVPAPMGPGSMRRLGQCWIPTSSVHSYGYLGSCASPLARDPALDPTYNGEF